MEVVEFPKTASLQGWMVNVTEEEALRLIHSLTTQLLYKNANKDREEFYTKDDKYFSIAILFEIEKTNAKF
jgi:hypothetical protein